MSTSPEPSPVNRSLSPVDNNDSNNDTKAHASDSDLSDVHVANVDIRSARSSQSEDEHEDARQAADFQDESLSDAIGESDDGDFEMADDIPPIVANGEANGSVASSSSSRDTKRKVGADVDEQYMRDDPELYGLRRSARPQPRRQIVDSDDNSDLDDLPSNRRATKKRRLDKPLPTSKPDIAIRQVASDDSDSDNYGGARARTFQNKARRQQEREPSAVLAEKRWSSRRAAQVTAGAYEESDAELEDDEEAAVTHWTVEEDNSPYIEKIVRHRLKDGLELRIDSSRHEFEYYIKWQGQSHLHDTWETTESVAGFRGFRRLENYFRKVVDVEIDMRFDESQYTPEQREQWLLDHEREEEAHEDYTKVERVVAARDIGDGDEYLVKWKGLQYDECTWEGAKLVSERAQTQIDRYLDRASRSWQSDRKETNLDTRSRMTKLEEQPTYVRNGQLREFQLKGLNFLALNWTRGNNVILADEMGLGKTVQSVSFLSWLRNDRGQEGPFLVVAPLSVIPAWCDTFDHWAPDINYVVYLGPEAARSTIREHELLVDGNPRKPKFNVLVTSYDYILADPEFLKSIKWQVLAVDEAHRLKNKESQLYGKLLSFNIPCKMLITGTPIQNNLAELSALLDFLNPGKVMIDEELELLAHAEKKDEVDDGDADKHQQTQEKLQQLHVAIAPFILRRTKETVESDLPPKTEKILRVELADVQLDYYKNILTRNYAALSDVSSGHKQSLLNIMMELKKVSNHPYMFPGVEERVLAGSDRREDQIKGLVTSSGKMMLLDRLLTKLKKDGHRVLIFSQMVKMLDILGDYLRIRGHTFQRLDGTIPAAPRRMAINHFNAEGSDDFCFLLSTRAGGLGINLMTADTVIIYDSDWNPQADLQAMARAHRIGQKKPVTVYRLVARQTIEEEVVKRARNKLFLEYLTIQAGVTDEGSAIRQQMEDRGIKVDEAKTTDDIQHILKMRSQDLFVQSGNQEKLEQLDIDDVLAQAEVTKTAVADKLNLSSGGIDWDNWMQVTDVKLDEAALDWDQIIPADQLAAVKAEEEKKVHDEYLAQAMEENAPRKAALKGSRKTVDNDRADRLAKKRQRELQEAEELEEQRTLLSDPRRPLNEKETRNLIRAFFRYGSMDDRGQEVIHEARLTDRDHDFVAAILQDLINASQDAVDASNDRIKEEENRLGKQLAKKDKKATLVDFGEVKKVNAETVVDRPPQLRLLRQIIKEHDNNATFRLTDASKAAHYTCEWGAREDGMLLIGLDRYGFGAWAQIRDDAELNMQDRFFLEEHRVDKKEERKKGDEKGIQSPGAVHLVRRSEYLLSVLAAKYGNDEAAKRAVENHHRSKKNLIGNGHRRDNAAGSASPAPQPGKKLLQNRDRNRERATVDHHRSRASFDERGTPRPDHKRKHGDEYDDRHNKIRRLQDQDHHDNSRPSSSDKHSSKDKSKGEKLDSDALQRLRNNRDEAVKRFNRLMKLDDDKLDTSDNEQLIWSLLRQVRGNFEKIMYTTADRIPSAKERAKTMGTELRHIGDHLNRLRNIGLPREQLDTLMPQLWDFLSTLWPIGDFEVSGKRLSRMYKNLSEKDGKGAEDKAPQQPPRNNGVHNGKKRGDLEDGEIDDEHHRRQERRERERERERDRDRERERERDAPRSSRPSTTMDESRHDNYRRDDHKYRDRAAYENGDRLSFRRDRSLSDRGHAQGYGHSQGHGQNHGHGRSSWMSPAPPHRHSPY